MMTMHNVVRLASVLALGLAALTGSVGTAATAAPSITPVNLAHLDFLHDTVPYTTPIAGHSTTDPGQPIDTWWVYANFNAATNSYTRVGGGTYDAVDQHLRPGRLRYGRRGTRRRRLLDSLPGLW